MTIHMDHDLSLLLYQCAGFFFFFFFFTIRLLSAGLDEVLFGCLCISHLQSGYPCPVQCLDIAWPPPQHPQAVVPHTSIVDILPLQQTG